MPASHTHVLLRNLWGMISEGSGLMGAAQAVFSLTREQGIGTPGLRGLGLHRFMVALMPCC